MQQDEQYMRTVSTVTLSCAGGGRAAVHGEDTGNYTCELRGPQSQVLRYVTHHLFVRGNTRLRCSSVS